MMAAMDLTYDMQLSSLLENLVSVSPELDLDVAGIATDSRKVKAGDLFLACFCKYSDGIQYIENAISAGACAVIAETGCLPEDVIYSAPLFFITELHTKVGIIAARFYGQPSRNMTVIGVTGTDGKTSVSYLLAQALSIEQKNTAGFIGTLGYGIVNNLEPGPNTTPDPITLQKLLADMRDQGISTVVMEVSSHGIDQYRIAGVEFDLAIFTNLGRDHLDYHGDIRDYSSTKQRFFTEYSIGKVVINLDDDTGKEILNKLGKDIKAVAYSLVEDLDVPLNDTFQTVLGNMHIDSFRKMTMDLKTSWGEGSLRTNLLGKFNAYNLMACLASLCLLGMRFGDALERLSRCKNIPGRMESFGGGRNPHIFVDYAHTPDALAQILQTLKSLCHGKLYCVFGCGGDRDQGKRPQMGTVAQLFADVIVLTNDNPRYEDPNEIIQDINKGIQNHDHLYIETDRETAIVATIARATENDIVLIAGKGHESYQETGGIHHPFRDQDIVSQALRKSK